MRLRWILGVLTLIPAIANGQSDDFAPYHALLARQCPAKHLEWLSPGELDDLIEVNFHDMLPEKLRAKLDAADDVEKRICASVTIGLVCFNGAYMKAISDAGLLPRFTRMVCNSGLSCRGQSACRRQ